MISLYWFDSPDGEYQGHSVDGKLRYVITPKGVVLRRIPDGSWRVLEGAEEKIAVLMSLHHTIFRRPSEGERLLR